MTVGVNVNAPSMHPDPDPDLLRLNRTLWTALSFYIRVHLWGEISAGKGNGRRSQKCASGFRLSYIVALSFQR